MKKEILSISMLVISGLAFAQVGINTPDPKATFDIVAKSMGANTAEGLIAPRLRGDDIQAKDAQYLSAQTGAIVYATVPVTSPSGKTINITAPGYYYFNGTIWIRFTNNLAKNGLSNDADYVKLGGSLTEPTVISTNAANNLVIQANDIGGPVSGESNQGFNVLATATTSANAIALRGRVLQTTGTVGQLRGVTGVSTLTGGTVTGSSNGGYFNNQLAGGTLGNNAIMSAVSGDVEAVSGTVNASNVMIGGRFGAGLAPAVKAGRAIGVLATAGGSETANIGALSIINDPLLTNPKVGAMGLAITGANNGAAVVAINPTTTANNYAIYSDGNVALKSLPTSGSTSLVGIDANGNLSTTAMAGATADNGLTKTADNIQLGGPLVKPTDIALNGNNLSISNASNTTALFRNDGSIALGNSAPVYSSNKLEINLKDVGGPITSGEQNLGVNILASTLNNATLAVGLRSRLEVPSGTSITGVRGLQSNLAVNGNLTGGAGAVFFNNNLGATGTLGANASLTGISGDASSSAGAPAGAVTNSFTGARFGANATNTPNATAVGVGASAIGSATSNTGVNAVAAIVGTSVNNAGLVTAVGPLATVGTAITTARTNRNAALVAVNPNAAGTGTTERAIYSSGGVQLENLGTTTPTQLVGIDAAGNLSTTVLPASATPGSGLQPGTAGAIDLGGTLTRQTTINSDAANTLVVNASNIGGASSEANQGFNVLATATTNSANAIALRGRVLQTSGSVGQLRGVTGVSTVTGGTVTGSSNGGYFNNQLAGGALAPRALISGVSGDVEATSGTADATNVMIGGRFGSVVSGSVNSGLAVGVLATAGGSTTANMGSLSVINDPTLANVGAASVAVGGAGNGAAVVAVNPKSTANNYAIYSDGNVALKNLPATGSTSLVGIDANGNLSTTAMAGAVTADNGLTKTLDNVQLGGPLTKQTTIDTNAANNLVINSTGIGDNNVEQNQGLNVLATSINSPTAKAIAVRGRISQSTGSIGQARGVSGAANITGGTINGTATGAYFNSAIGGTTLPSNGIMTGVSADAETIGSNTNEASNTFAGARFGANVNSAPSTHSAGVVATAVGSTASNVGIAASTTTDAAILTGKVNALPAGTNIANYSYAPAGTNNFATYSDGNVVMKNLPTTGSTSLVGIDAAGNLSTTALPITANSWNLTGNLGTNPATNFLGTTDNIPLAFRVNNQPSGRIDATNANVFFGAQAGYLIPIPQGTNTSINNTLIGQRAGYNATLGAQGNTAIGSNSLLNTNGIGVYLSGTYNTALGFESGKTNVGGKNNLFLGASSDGTIAGLNNASAIGFGAKVGADNSMVLGNSVVRVGIGNNIPTNKLHITATADPLRLEGLQAGALTDNIVVADGTGVLKTIASTGLAIEPWNVAGTTNKATANTDNIYQMGKVGIGTSTPSSALQVTGGATPLEWGMSVSNTTADNIIKYGYVKSPAFNTANPPLMGMVMRSTATESRLEVGGLSSTHSAPTDITFVTDNDNNLSTPLGTVRARIDGNGNFSIGNDATVNNPTNRMHIQATADPLRLEGLQAGAVSNLLLSTDATGVVKTINRTTLTAGAGSENVAIGNTAGNPLNTGEYNVFIGLGSGGVNTTGLRNTALGVATLPLNTTGNLNTALGYSTLRKNTTGLNNTAIGAYSMLNNTAGIENISIGYQSLYTNTTGNSNISIGKLTSGNISTGSNNIAIGNYAYVNDGNGSNQISIGNLIYANGADAQQGNVSSGNVGIGVKNPTAKLEVNGKIKAKDVNFSGLPTYADESAASSLTTGDMYKTPTGELRIKL